MEFGLWTLGCFPITPRLDLVFMAIIYRAPWTKSCPTDRSTLNLEFELPVPKVPINLIGNGICEKRQQF